VSLAAPPDAGCNGCGGVTFDAAEDTSEPDAAGFGGAVEEADARVLDGADVPVLTGAGVPVLDGAGVPMLDGTGVPMLDGAGVPVLDGAGVAVPAGPPVPVDGADATPPGGRFLLTVAAGGRATGGRVRSKSSRIISSTPIVVRKSRLAWRTVRMVLPKPFIKVGRRSGPTTTIRITQMMRISPKPKLNMTRCRWCTTHRPDRPRNRDRMSRAAEARAQRQMPAGSPAVALPP
jgi:hypothetical protein